MHVFDYTFSIDDYAYFANGDLKQFTINALSIDPVDAVLSSSFVHTAVIAISNSPLPINLLTFD